MMSTEIHSPLGKTTVYISHYQPNLLFPIARQLKRDEIGVTTSLPFKGVDVWNAFELSWLNASGKPMVAVGEFIFPCESPFLIESKSFKLYLNSFNNTKFPSMEKVHETLQKDLSAASGATVKVKMIPLEKYPNVMTEHFSGIYLDSLDVACDRYTVDASYLKTADQTVSEKVYSNLLKSNCPVTGQPDWASVRIEYTGKKIQHAGLLQYIVSFREFNEFHEQCVERMFVDISNRCKPEKLLVEARYTRRGGLDINPIRSSVDVSMLENRRLVRQ